MNNDILKCFDKENYVRNNLFENVKINLCRLNVDIIIHDEYNNYKTQFEYRKTNDELIIITLYWEDEIVDININEFDIVLNDNKQTIILDEFFKANYQIVEYYYKNTEVYTEFVWDSIPEYNIKYNILFRYPYLLKIKEIWKKDNKLEEKIRYSQLP